MLRITKLTDYAIVVLAHLVRTDGQHLSVSTARDLAERSRLPAPTVSKILKELARAGLVESERGLAGGYRLARAATAITVADVVKAVEGPIAVTECSRDGESCDYTGHCPVESNWVKINHAIFGALENITLEEMSRPLGPRLVQLSAKPHPTNTHLS
ncbi:MAG: SUF system Fe-S cluster assembly regulator [Polyangiaceae bacterium]|nr:SUF system Fe-S cluster assembly regulator [Polyangiaceae bacterium]